MKTRALLGLAALTIGACTGADTPVAPTLPHHAASVATRMPALIPGRYIVVFRPGVDVDRESSRLAMKLSGKVTYTYRTALRGMAIELPGAAAAALAAETSVASIEQDQVMSVVATQTGATWGLDRIDQRMMPLDGSYTYNADGTGVTAYIIDTGILFAHSQFSGRATTGYDAITAGGAAADCNGHGTHVAGTVGGATYGVAKNVKLVAVRVLDCNGSGSTSGVIAGVDWVTANSVKPAVANMSLGGGASSTLDNAVANSIASGITYGLAAGNGDSFGNPQDACTRSPARVSTGITVSATNNADTKASWANYGTCVDMFAPGVGITSAWYTSATATNTISGTSMATPHVVGAAALYMQANPTATPAQVASALPSNATANVVVNAGPGSPNLLLYSAFIGAAPPPMPPVARFVSSCSALVCSFDASSSSALALATYSWSFGDGTTGAGKTTSHGYVADGSYSVTLTVTDANGSNSTTQLITVSSAPAAPVASFSYRCSSRTCSFDASATTGATSYSWDFGDGSSGSGVSTSHSFAPNRNYTVTLTATGSGGTSSTSKPISCVKKGCS